MKEKANMFIQGLNNEFGNILQKVRLFFLRFFPMGVNYRLVFCPELSIKTPFLAYKSGGGRLLRAWAFYRDFTVLIKSLIFSHSLYFFNFWIDQLKISVLTSIEVPSDHCCESNCSNCSF